MDKVEICRAQLEDLAASGAFCRAFASVLQSGDVVLLSGPLAIGKTTFVQAMVAALGSSDTVTSPTYAIGQFYQSERAGPLLHIDTYRLASVPEFLDTGLADHFDETIAFVEWGGLLEEGVASYWSLDLAPGPGGPQERRVKVWARGERMLTRAPALRAALGKLGEATWT